MTAFAYGLARLLLACLAIIGAVVLGFALVALAVYFLLWVGVP